MVRDHEVAGSSPVAPTIVFTRACYATGSNLATKLTAAPPPEEPTAYGSLAVDFTSPLRRFVVLKDVEFSDASGTYSLIEAWVNTGKGGGAFFDETLLEKGGFQLVDIHNYRVHDDHLGILLKLRAMGTGSGLPVVCGTNLGYSDVLVSWSTDHPTSILGSESLTPSSLSVYNKLTDEIRSGAGRSWPAQR